MNANLVAPQDEEAERTVAGCAADNVHGSLLAHQRLEAADFYVPACRRIFEAAETVGWTVPVAERVASIADEATVDEADVWALVRERPVIHDTSGSYARRVLDASRRRRMMAVALDVYNALGEGGALAEAVAVLDSVGGDVRDGITSATGSATGSDHVSHRPEPVPA